MIVQGHTAHPAPKLSSSLREETASATRREGTDAAIDAADRIRQEFPDLGRRELLRIVTAFRRALIPRQRRGRRPSKEITAAHADWKCGMCGVALYRKHIVGFDRMSRWKRQGKSRALMEAIRSRERRSRPLQTVQPR